jgi:hypothetical protein
MSRELSAEELRQVNYVVAAIGDVILSLADGKDDDELVFIGHVMEDVARQCNRPDVSAEEFEPMPAGELRARYRAMMAELGG